MATLTKQQIEAKKQQLKQLIDEVNVLTRELVEAGAIEIPEEQLTNVSGGVQAGIFTEGGPGEFNEKQRQIQQQIEERNKPKKPRWF